jgi:hypothetical protein
MSGRQDEREWTGFVWLRIGKSSGILWTWECTFGFYENVGIFVGRWATGGISSRTRLHSYIQSTNNVHKPNIIRIFNWKTMRCGAIIMLVECDKWAQHFSQIILQSTPLPALASQHTICWLYLNVCIQIANKLGNLKKKKKKDNLKRKRSLERHRRRWMAKITTDLK